MIKFHESNSISLPLQLIIDI